MQFAARIGVPDTTYGNYERGDRLPDAAFLAQLRRSIGTDLNWLVSGDPVELVDVGGEAGLPLDDAARIVIPRYDARASAGAGGLVVSPAVEDYFSVPRSILQQFLPSWAPPNARVGILSGAGDSMEPTIHDGDLLLVVEGVEWVHVRAGGIFVFGLDGHLLLKRLQVLSAGDLRIISDNKAYEPETILKRELEDRVEIYAQVFLTGGRPRSLR